MAKIKVTKGVNMTIKPLFDRVLLRNVSNNTSSKKSNIILPENPEKSIISVVEAIGTGGTLDGNEIKFEVKVGDKVLYNKFSAHEFNIDGETFTIISQADILGIIKEK